MWISASSRYSAWTVAGPLATPTTGIGRSSRRCRTLAPSVRVFSQAAGLKISPRLGPSIWSMNESPVPVRTMALLPGSAAMSSSAAGNLPCAWPVNTTGPPSVWNRSTSTPSSPRENAKFSYLPKYSGVVIMRSLRTGAAQLMAPASATCGAVRRDISHSCRSPASAARCSGSIAPVVLSALNTGLRQPHEQAAWTPPSPTSRIVVWWSTAIGVLQVNDRAGQRPRHAVEDLDPGGYQLAQLVDVPRICLGNDVVGSGHARRLRDARQVSERGSDDGRLADFGLDQNVRGDHVTTTRPSRTIQPPLRSWVIPGSQAEAAGMAWTRVWPPPRQFSPAATPNCPARVSVPGAVAAAAREPARRQSQPDPIVAPGRAASAPGRRAQAHLAQAGEPRMSCGSMPFRAALHAAVCAVCAVVGEGPGSRPA